MKGRGFHNPLSLSSKLPHQYLSSAGRLCLLLLSTSVLGMAMVEPTFLQGETSAACQNVSSWIAPEMMVVGLTTASKKPPRNLLRGKQILWLFPSTLLLQVTCFPRPYIESSPESKATLQSPKMWWRNGPFTSPIEKHGETDHFKPDEICLL